MSEIILSLYKFKKQLAENSSESSTTFFPFTALIIKEYQSFQLYNQSICSNLLILVLFLFCIVPAELLYLSVVTVDKSDQGKWIIHFLQLLLAFCIGICGIFVIYFKINSQKLVDNSTMLQEQAPPSIDRKSRFQSKKTPGPNLSILSGLSILGKLSARIKQLTDVDMANLKELTARLLLAEQMQFVLIVGFMSFVFLSRAFQATCYNPQNDESEVSNETEKLLYLLFEHCSTASITVGSKVLVFMLLPMIVSHLFPAVKIEWHLLHHLITIIVCFIALACSSGDQESYIITYLIVSVWTIAGMYLLAENYFQQISIFFMAYRNHQTIEEKDRDADRRSATEMRHMIGNVAHDLKTPLSSFTTGLEVISDILDKNQDMIEKLKNPQLSCNDKVLYLNEVESSSSSIGQCLKNIQDTNTFMLMTINRCIDYTKASRGFKLVPKYETVDLLETLRLPLDCMKNIQERISIRLIDENLLKHLQVKSALPATPDSNKDNEDVPDICSHIITDKQWLQENILCLLSNAVKYSNGGEVTIRVYLIATELLPVKKPVVVSPPASPLTRMNSKNTFAAPPQRFASVLMKHLSFKDTSPMFRQLTINNLFSQNKKVLPTNRYFEENSSSGHVLDQSISASKYDEESQQDKTEEATPTIQKKRFTKGTLGNLDTVEYHLRFDIEDTGIGMSNEAMNQLFNPFRQAQRLAGGTGLGLYSLAKRMDALNGCFGVSKRSDGQQGSLFWFSIPYKPDQTTADLLQAFQIQKQHSASMKTANANSSVRNNRRNSIITIPMGAGSPVPGAPARRCSLISPVVDMHEMIHNLSILLVEDSPSIAKMSTMLLKRMGHSIKVAENGEIALKKIQEEWETNKKGFDLILMDLQMPVMDGLEATRRLRQIEQEGRSWLPSNETKGEVGGSFTNGHQRSSISDHSSSLIRVFTAHFSSVSSSSGRSEVMSFYHHPVVGVSANSDDETVNDAMEAGLDAFMPKPFTSDVFNTTVFKVIQTVKKSTTK